MIFLGLDHVSKLYSSQPNINLQTSLTRFLLSHTPKSTPFTGDSVIVYSGDNTTTLPPRTRYLFVRVLDLLSDTGCLKTQKRRFISADDPFKVEPTRVTKVVISKSLYNSKDFTKRFRREPLDRYEDLLGWIQCSEVYSTSYRYTNIP